MRTKNAVNRRLPLSEFLSDSIDPSTQLPTAPRGETTYTCEVAYDGAPQHDIASKCDNVNWRRPPSGPHANANAYRPPALNASFRQLTVRTENPWASPKIGSPLSDVSSCSSHETVSMGALIGSSPDRCLSHPCSPHDSPKLRANAFGEGRPRELVLAERAKRAPDPARMSGQKPSLCDWRSQTVGQRSSPIDRGWMFEDRSSPMRSAGIPELDRIDKMTPKELAALFSY